ncbi:MAG: hypothetical protein ED557_12555 [Balneola sp.]|nr:MAG: hypothetical protein ED557_12555 [Balneola sp.]
MKRALSYLLLAGVLASSEALAQDGQDPVKYSSLSQQFVTSTINGDANASVLPSVATQNGFGSYLDNPASMALITMSYFNTGLISNTGDHSSSYLGSDLGFDDTRTSFGNIGMIYSVPVTQGSMVVGGGYSLRNDFNRTNIFNGRNTNSSITDMFKQSGSDYNSIAFESYAIDYADIEQTSLESIFRIGFAPGEFLGIQQEGEMRQRGTSGEYTLFMATEIQKNLFIGASIGAIYGNYSFERSFLEIDEGNIYDGDFIDVDSEGNGGTDVASILLEDELDMEISGANLNIGVIYQVLPKVNLGASFLLPTRLNVTEEYSSSILTRLDDGRTPFGDDFSGNFNYKIRRPWELNLGFALEEINRVTISAAVELIDYRNTSLDLTSSDDSAFRTAELREQEAIFDSVFTNSYNFVANLSGGIKYKSRTGFELRGGAAFLPGKSSDFEADRLILSGGLGIPLSRELYLDITTQYTGWDDRSILYEYLDPISGQVRTESIDETISQINVMVGLKYRF